MLRNRNIIYVSNAWDGDNKTSAHHIAEELSKHNRLLYVEAAGQRAPRATGRDYKKILQKLASAMKPPRRVSDSMYLYSPLILPFHGYSIVRKFNELLLKFFMARCQRSLSFKDPVLWTVMPHYAAILDSVRADVVVYYVVDEYASQPNVDAEAIRMLEQRVLSKADVVFCVSEQLVESKSRLHANVHLSTHGVDLERFSRARDNGAGLPPDIGAIKRPIIGFFGLIEEWIDLELIRYLADQRPNYSFVLIGSVVQPPGDLTRYDNVWFLGHKPYEELPDYLRAFDVALLPYKLNEQVINSNPKKLREYLSGGKPVVSVRVREVERYADVVRIADDPPAFLAAVDAALEDHSESAVAARAAAVADEGWPAKVERISTIVASHLD